MWRSAAYQGDSHASTNNTSKVLSNNEHILEIYNFPSSMKTQHLERFLIHYSERVRIKWVDETHALGVFLDSTTGTHYMT